MWEVKVKITMTVDEGDETTVAELRVRIDHTATDADGEYLPDDEVTHDRVYEAVNEWQNRTGLKDDDTTMIQRYYQPEKAKRV